MWIRIALAIILLLSVFFLPFWTSILLLLAAMAYLPVFWEGVVIFFVSDLLFGAEREALFNIVFLSALIALTLLMLMETIKKKLRFYPNN